MAAIYSIVGDKHVGAIAASDGTVLIIRFLTPVKVSGGTYTQARA
jgi:hypothetical protein